MADLASDRRHYSMVKESTAAVSPTLEVEITATHSLTPIELRIRSSSGT